MRNWIADAEVVVIHVVRDNENDVGTLGTRLGVTKHRRCGKNDQVDHEDSTHQAIP